MWRAPTEMIRRVTEWKTIKVRSRGSPRGRYEKDGIGKLERVDE